jgi:hypothetical protein
MTKLVLALAGAFFWTSPICGQNYPVIVELFTSQGCSSCPAADKALTEILDKGAAEGKPIYGLSFHVDYWNYIGWKGPYSSKEFTARQRHYAEKLHLSSIYTPQIVVNGRNEFVGSEKLAGDLAVAAALQEKPLYKIAITNFESKEGVIRFQYVLDKVPNGEVINLAIVEKAAENYVSKGENKGKKLHHSNVVRTFVTKPAMKQQLIELEIPQLSSTQVSLILFLQDKDWSIVASTSKSLH